MDYRDYQPEDLVLDAGFRNYCLGKEGPDLVFWNEWVILHPDRYERILMARELFFLLNGKHTAENYREDLSFIRDQIGRHLSSAGEELAMERIGEELAVERIGEEKIEAESSPVRRIRPLRRVIIFAAAASVAAFMLFIGIRKTVPAPSAGDFSGEALQISKAGERKSFQLPDGTQVMLNAGSSIRISKTFNTANRELTLEGEAFFDVAKDAGRPFLIHTTTMDIRVLGTSFNVKVYPGDRLTETSLLNGSVEVLVKGAGNKKIILHPREKIVIPADAGAVLPPLPATKAPVRTIPATDSTRRYRVENLVFNRQDSTLTEVSWTANRLSFNDQSLGEIARALERWYNVSIRFEDEGSRDFRFTASFDKQTIEEVLDALAVSNPFSYRVEGNKIFIKNKNMND